LQSFLAAVWARNLAFSDRDEGGIIHYLLDHLDQNLTLDQLATRAGTTRYHFCRSFHRKTGYPPMEYFLRLKIQRACELLETSPGTVKQISEKLAFSSPYYFSNVFKKFTGVPPSTYRMRHREKG
jgi:AraC-like DNA-binding protein